MGAQFDYAVSYRTNASAEVIEEKLEEIPAYDDIDFEYVDGEVFLRASFYSSFSFNSDFEEQLRELVSSTLVDGTVARLDTCVDGEEGLPDFISTDVNAALKADIEHHTKQIEYHTSIVNDLKKRLDS